MKKRFGAVLVLTLLIVMMTTSFCFAGTLTIEDTYPRTGAKGMQIENSGVKLYFNQNMINKENEKANLDCFKFTNDKGQALPIRVLYSPKEKGLVLVLVDNQTLESDSKYKLYISGDVMSASGDTLGEDMEISFKTVNTKTTMNINMAMTGIMMVAMIWASSKAAKKQVENENVEKAIEEKVNPYKVAKETGKSVAQVLEEEKREKEKQRKKLEKKLAKEAELYEDDEEDIEEYVSDNKRVKGPRSAAAFGSVYAKKRIADAEEARKKKAQAGTTNPKKKGKKKK